MKNITVFILFLLSINYSIGQDLVKIDDKLPKYNFTKVINSPNSEFDISDLKDKPKILVFWGTWCGPCIPEMVKLGDIQDKFAEKIQVIGVSNDNEDKLKTFLQKHPSKIWFASDPSQNLWNIFGINTAGRSALIDKNNNVIKIAETHLIDSSVIINLINSKQINLEENRGERRLTESENPFKLDSSTVYSFVVQSELKGILPMIKRPNSGSFAKKRITVINLVPTVILKEAFGIATSEKVVYLNQEDSIKSNSNPICVDFIVSNDDKPNLKSLFQSELNKHLSVKGETIKKVIPCFILKQIDDKSIEIKKSSKSNNEYSSSQVEFNGEGVPITTFVNYLESVLGYPVFNETGLTQHYDIDFSKNNVEPLQSTKDSLAKLGLELVKDEREFDVLLISSR